MKLTAALSILLFLINSCVYRLNSEKYDNTDHTKIGKKDIVYALNKTILEVEIVYNRKVEKTILHGVSKTSNPLYTVKTVNVSPKSINDGEVFIARGKNLSHSFFLKENIDFKFNDNGSLKSITSEFDDESPQLIQDLTSSFASIAKTVATAGTPDQYMKDLQNDINLAYNDYQKKIKTNKEKPIIAAKKKLDRLIELLENYSKANKKEIITTELKFKVIVDPDTIQWENNKKSIKIGPESADVPAFPQVSLTISDNRKQSALIPFKDLTNNNTALVNGIVYRLPAELHVTVESNYSDKKVEIFNNYLKFPQYGSYATIPVTSKLFSKRKTELAFDQTNGTLLSYKTESGSSSANLGKAIKESSKTLNETVEYLKYDQKIKELENTKKIKDLKNSLEDPKTSEIDSLKSSFELEKIRREIEDFQNTELSDLEKLKHELEILKLKLEIEGLGK